LIGWLVDRLVGLINSTDIHDGPVFIGGYYITSYPTYGILYAINDTALTQPFTPANLPIWV
jgi:hypothetical protein